jgi:hypothetical protein
MGPIVMRGTFLILLTALLPPASFCPAATNQQIDQAIQRAKAFLYSHQNKSGTWETTAAPERARGNSGRGETDGAQWGGLTAMSTYALLAAGDRATDPRLARAITFLKTVRFVGTYALAMRCQVWAMLPQDADVRRHARADSTALIAAMVEQGQGRGFYNYVADRDAYPIPQWWWDLSNGQMAVLGVWACDLANYPQGAQVPLDYWRTVDQAWRAAQLSNGGWPYTTQGRGEMSGPRLSMTAAGVATLYITENYLQREAGLECRNTFTDTAIDSGMNYIVDHIDELDESSTSDCYTLYGLERIGAASGERFFKTLDWYRLGADYLMRNQNPNGSWGPNDLNDVTFGQGFPHNPLQIPNTCFSMVFLARGRAPVAITKLQYGERSTWDQRPRDAANVTYWLAKQTEMDLNWQTLNLDAPIDALHDSPIAYIAGNGPITLSPEQENRLRQYIEEGGLLVGNADCGGPAFSASFVALGKRLFPAYEFRPLPKGNLIQTGEIYKPRVGREQIALRGLSNGVRELMLLIPTADVGQNWQAQRSLERPEQFQLMENILVYATDRLNGLLKKGEWNFPRINERTLVKQRVKIARLRFAGNWNPEPAGWRRLGAIFHNQQGVDLDVADIDLNHAAIDPSYQLASLTGTGAFTLSPAAQEAIQQYVAAEGTLLVDPAGGDSDFAASAEKELAAMFPDAQPQNPPWFGNLPHVAYRTFGHDITDQSDAGRLRGLSVGNRLAIYYSRDDISAGLVGQEMDGIRGYDPQTATEIVEKLISLAASLPPPAESPSPSTTQSAQ